MVFKNNKFIKLVYWILLLLFVSIIILTNTFDIENPSFVSSDSSINLKFSRIYSSSGELAYKISSCDPKGIFLRPTYGTTFFNGTVVPEKFVGFMIFIGFIISTIGENIVPYLNLMFFIFILIILYKINNEYYDKKNSFKLLIFIASFSPLIYFTQYDFLENIIAPFLFLLVILCVLKVRSNKNNILLIPIFVLTSYSMTIRPDLLLFYFPLFYFLKTEMFHFPRTLIFSIFLAILFISPLFIINNTLYGSPFTFGLTTPAEDGSLRNPTPGFIDFPLSNFPLNLGVIVGSELLVLFAILSYRPAYNKRDIFLEKYFVITFILCSLFYLTGPITDGQCGQRNRARGG